LQVARWLDAELYETQFRPVELQMLLKVCSFFFKLTCLKFTRFAACALPLCFKEWNIASLGAASRNILLPSLL